MSFFYVLTWRMAYMMQVRGRWWECSETLKMFRPHLLMFSRSYIRQERIRSNYGTNSRKIARFPCNRWSVTYNYTLESKSSKSVFTPNLAVLLLLGRPGPCVTFLTPLIWFMSCCCLLFLSRDFEVGEGISSSFCLSTGGSFRPVTHEIVHFSTRTLNSQQQPGLFRLIEWVQIHTKKLVQATYKFSSWCNSSTNSS